MIHNAIGKGRGLLTSFGIYVGLADEEEGTVRLGESLTPILDLWARPEAAILRDETLFAGTVFSAAVAGELSFGSIKNHATSGKLMLVERFEIAQLTASLVLFTVLLAASTDEDSTVAVRPRDTRWSTTPGFVMGVGAGAAAVGDEVWRSAVEAGGRVSCPPFVLHPGRELRAYSSSTLLAAVISASGFVRAFKPGENVTK